jgi:hypothetical protein
MRSDGVAALSAESQRSWPDGNERRRGAGVAAGEEDDRVALADELVGEIRDDTLGTSVESGWNAFRERRDLGYTHPNSLEPDRSPPHIARERRVLTNLGAGSRICSGRNQA